MANVPTDAQLARQAAEATLRNAARATKANSSKKNVRAASTDSASQVTATATPWQLNDTNWDANKNNTTGFKQGVSKGYDAIAGGLNARRKALAMSHSNAYLLDGNKGLQIPMFVSSTNIDTSLAGSTAQSQLVQDFYPRNFVQPVINVAGWSLDQEDYGTLCEFVHTCQFNALSAAQLWTTSMTQLIVMGRTGITNAQGVTRAARVPVGNRTSGRAVKATFNDGSSHSETHVNQTIKGDHENIIAKGYIQSMTRSHQQFQYAVYWQFDFVVAQMIEGPFRENVATATNVATNGMGMAAKLVADATSDGLATVSATQNAASLAHAASHSSQLAHPTPTGGTANASTSSSPSGGGGSTPSGGGAVGPAGTASDTHSSLWARDLLEALPAPITTANVTSLTTWIQREGNDPSINQFNPLDTTEPGYGGTGTNSVGVRTYPTWQDGINATVATLLNGYPNIVAGLKSGSGLPSGGSASAELLKWSGGGYSGI
jgi:hypothetical protein